MLRKIITKLRDTFAPSPKDKPVVSLVSADRSRAGIRPPNRPKAAVASNPRASKVAVATMRLVRAPTMVRARNRRPAVIAAAPSPAVTPSRSVP